MARTLSSNGSTLFQQSKARTILWQRIHCVPEEYGSEQYIFYNFAAGRLKKVELRLTSALVWIEVELSWVEAELGNICWEQIAQRHDLLRPIKYKIWYFGKSFKSKLIFLFLRGAPIFRFFPNLEDLIMAHILMMYGRDIGEIGKIRSQYCSYCWNSHKILFG